MATAADTALVNINTQIFRVPQETQTLPGLLHVNSFLLSLNKFAIKVP
jgi:hypothetical protein